MMCSELVTVAFHKDHQPESTATVNLEEISETTALLLAETPIPAGSRLKIACQQKELTGVVSSCRRDAELGYFIAVKLHRHSHWSLQLFTPEHLLALPASLGNSKPNRSHSSAA